MGERQSEPIAGMAAGVPFTALPLTGTVQGPAPLVVTWHMLDAPRTDAAFAAALTMTGSKSRTSRRERIRERHHLVQISAASPQVSLVSDGAPGQR